MSEGRDQVASKPLLNESILKILKEGNSQTFSVAKDAIKRQVLMATMQEALEELGDAEAIAQQALEHLGREHPVLGDASASLVKRLLAETAHRSHQELADAETVAQHARDYLDAVPEAVQRGSAALKARLLDEVAMQSITALADAEATADAARAQLSDNEDTLVRGKDALVAKLIGEIAMRSADALADTEAASTQAKLLLGEEPETVTRAQAALTEALLHDIATLSTEALSNASAAADVARERLGDEPASIRNAGTVLKEKLLEEVAQRAATEIADAEEAAKEAKRRLSDDPEVVVSATASLVSFLLQEIAQRAADDLLDAGNSAKQARSYLSEDPHAVLEGSAVLKTSLLHEIARRSTEALSDTQASAQEAMQYVSPNHEVILQVVDELRQHLLKSIVSESIKKINADVAQTTAGSMDLLGDLQGVLESVGNVSGNGAAPSQSDTAPPDATAGRAEEEAPHGDASNAAVETPTSALHPARRTAGNGYRVNDIALPDAIVHNERKLAEEAVTPGENVTLSKLAEQHPAGTVYYVYGIVSNTSEFETNAWQEAGLANGAPFLLPYQSVAALVGEVPMSEHTLQQMQDPAWKAESARQHERVLEQIMSEGHTILPLGFGTVFAHKHLLLRMLAKHYDAYEYALEALQGKQEWSVKIYCDPEKLRHVISDNEKKVDDFVDGFVDLMKSQIQKGVGIDIDNELEAVREGIEIEPQDLVENVFLNCEQYSYRALQSIASDSILNPPSDDDVFGDSRMILNAAFLVSEEKGDVFVEVLQTLTREHEALGFSYYVGGPHPACHFAYRAIAQAVHASKAA